MTKETWTHARKRGQSIVENSLLDDKDLSMQGKYLLIQFCSHRQGDWKIIMKDMVKRSSNGRDAHYKALTDLIHNKYVARIRVVTKKGRHEEVIYVFGQIKEDVSEMIDEVVAGKTAEGFVCRLEFGKPHPENQEVDSDKASESSDGSNFPHPENPNVENSDAESQYNTNNQYTNNQYTNLNNIKDIDDDKRSFSSPPNEEELNIIINTLREATKDDLTDRSFKSVLRKVIDKYNQGKVSAFRDYLATALINKIEDLELRRIKEQAKNAIKQDKLIDRSERESQLSTYQYTGKVPFYNWLEQ